MTFGVKRGEGQKGCLALKGGPKQIWKKQEKNAQNLVLKGKKPLHKTIFSKIFRLRRANFWYFIIELIV